MLVFFFVLKKLYPESELIQHKVERAEDIIITVKPRLKKLGVTLLML